MAGTNCWANSQYGVIVYSSKPLNILTGEATVIYAASFEATRSVRPQVEKRNWCSVELYFEQDLAKSVRIQYS